MHDDEAEYWSRLESTQRQWYPGFVKQVSSQLGAEQDEGQVAVITFQDGVKPHVRVFTKSKDLRRYLDSNSPPPSSPNVPECRRMFVLEGLPKKFIQLLGSRLRVPPSFFAAHWVQPGKFVASLLNQTLRSYDNQTRFTLASPKLHRAKIQGEPGDDADPVYFMQSSITRQLGRDSLFGEFEGPLWSYEIVSFWSACDRGSWDALLLVDPPLGNSVMWTDDPRPRLVVHESPENGNVPGISKDGWSQDGSWYPPFPVGGAGEAPGMKSVFDDLVRLYPSQQYQSTADPITCTDICKQLVLSAWTARLRVLEAEVIRKQYEMSIGPRTPTFNPRTRPPPAWTHPWTDEEFGRLVRAKSVLEGTKTTLFYNLDALGVGGERQMGEEWETAAWKSLQNALLTLKTRVDIMSEAYTLAVSVRESIVANAQARQVGYLTSLATLFIPVSFIAAVFSMGGDYAAGERKFYVFWAISLPIAVVASCLYLFGGFILGVLRKYSVTREGEKSPV
ncbi:uncharacterized protein B0H64DRAFT_393421 [Chaetomium fimeti]|uniref:Uncharacterized protein n=1 Tax=Chaetomium fimeti TaxID=1854472 RepID=A0AAE0LV32_9PEZI|nr:hypothetical protein B0H64DRAFT_393421 [Chaetomium fimeti]